MTTEPTTFRKKPVEIQAMRWNGTNESATTIIDWVLAGDGTATYRCSDPDRCEANDGDCPHRIAVCTPDSTGYLDPGDYVIRGIAGEFYPCRGDIFEDTYEVPRDAPSRPVAAVPAPVQGADPTDCPRCAGTGWEPDCGRTGWSEGACDGAGGWCAAHDDLSESRPEMACEACGDPTGPQETADGGEDDCPHCSPRHGDPASRTWGVRVGDERDGDGQPTHLRVEIADGSHVAPADARWLWQLIRDVSATRPQGSGETDCGSCSQSKTIAALRDELAGERAQRHRYFRDRNKAERAAERSEAERDDARYAAEQARAGVVAERKRADKAVRLLSERDEALARQDIGDKALNLAEDAIGYVDPSDKAEFYARLAELRAGAKEAQSNDC